MSQNNICDFCGEDRDVLYEGWFRTQAAFNPFAKGTASAGLLQLRRTCKECTQKAIDSGIACAKEFPKQRNEL